MEIEKRSLRQLQADVISDEESFQQFSRLLDVCFSVPEGCHYFDDFPVWNPKFGVFPLLRIGAFEGKKLVSTAAVRLGTLRPYQGSENSQTRIAIIGAVATDPLWRGMGLASRLISLSVDWARDKGASLVVLWSSEQNLYRRHGFELCGAQMEVPLAQMQITETPAEQVYRGWNYKLFELVRERRGGLILGDKDRGWFEGHKNVEWMYVGSSDSPKAYVAVGRGVDMNGIIHEWGGETKGLLSLLQFLKSNSPNLKFLCSPFHMEELGIPVPKSKLESLCMAKILDPEKLVENFFPKRDLTIQFKWVKDHWQIWNGLQISGTFTDQELTKVILGSPHDKGYERSGLFPLPLWVWGLDAS